MKCTRDEKGVLHFVPTACIMDEAEVRKEVYTARFDRYNSIEQDENFNRDGPSWTSDCVPLMLP